MAINFAKFDQWLVPSSRMVLGLLVLANVSVALFMTLTNKSPDQELLPAVAAPSAPEQTLDLALLQPATVEKPTPDSAQPLFESLDNGSAGGAGGGAVKEDMQGLQLAQAALPYVELAPRECRVWGPEASAEAFAALTRELQAAGSFPEVKATDIQASADYLVLIAELGSRDNAARVARELNGLEIDNFLITRDDGSPAISVGVFSREALAQRQLKRMLDMGYSAQIEPLQRAQTVYNLVAHVAVDSPLYETSISSCMNIAQGR